MSISTPSFSKMNRHQWFTRTAKGLTPNAAMNREPVEEVATVEDVHGLKHVTIPGDGNCCPCEGLCCTLGRQRASLQ